MNHPAPTPPRCGHPTAAGRTCRNPAGQGTTHEGEGLCSRHAPGDRKHYPTEAEHLASSTRATITRAGQITAPEAFADLAAALAGWAAADYNDVASRAVGKHALDTARRAARRLDGLADEIGGQLARHDRIHRAYWDERVRRQQAAFAAEQRQRNIDLADAAYEAGRARSAAAIAEIDAEIAAIGDQAARTPPPGPA